MKKPNILLIHSDQHRFDCLGCNGHPVLTTPNLDRLASEGVTFRNAFTPSPICSPARASLITGLWPTQHGCINIPGTESFRPIRDSITTIYPLLKDAGYWLGYVGKFHQETPQNPDAYGVDEFIPENAYSAWRSEKDLPPLQRVNGWFGECDPVKPEESRLAWGADHAIRMMTRAASSNTPFLVRWDPSEPHLPCLPPEPYNSMYPPQSVPPWPSFPDSLEGKPYIQELQQLRWNIRGWTWDQWAPVVSRYLGVISQLDHELGRILTTLDQLNLKQETLVIYTTDHGDFCGGHGMMDKHFCGYDDIIRVPLLMRMPGAIPSSICCEDFISHSIDIASTLLSAAGSPIPDQFTGRDLVESAAGTGKEPARTDILSMYQGCQMGLWSTRVIRDRRYKLVYHATERPEFYDIQDDPGERHNRANDPAVLPELNRLKERMIAWMDEINDPLLNSWTRNHLEKYCP